MFFSFSSCWNWSRKSYMNYIKHKIIIFAWLCSRLFQYYLQSTYATYTTITIFQSRISIRLQYYCYVFIIVKLLNRKLVIWKQLILGWLRWQSLRFIMNQINRLINRYRPKCQQSNCWQRSIIQTSRAYRYLDHMMWLNSSIGEIIK